MLLLEFLIDIIPSGRTMTLGSTEPLAELSTRKYFLGGGVKAAGALGLQTYHLHVPIVLKSWRLKLLEPSAHEQDCNGICVMYYMPSIHNTISVQ